jgi:hypothetical protein
VRAMRCGSGDMLDWDSWGPIAQRLEQQTHNLLVLGSNPSGPTKPHTVDKLSYRRSVFGHTW